MAHELACNPDIQQKLYEEIVSVQLDGKPATYEMIKELKYMEMVVSETLRLWPPIFQTDRQVTKPYHLQGNGNTVALTTNDSVWIPIYGIHTVWWYGLNFKLNRMFWFYFSLFSFRMPLTGQIQNILIPNDSMMKIANRYDLVPIYRLVWVSVYVLHHVLLLWLQKHSSIIYCGIYVLKNVKKPNTRQS